MKCPACGLFNPADAFACDCGYNFKTGSGGPIRERRSLKSRAISIIIALVAVWLFFKFLHAIGWDDFRF